MRSSTRAASRAWAVVGWGRSGPDRRTSSLRANKPGDPGLGRAARPSAQDGDGSGVSLGSGVSTSRRPPGCPTRSADGSADGAALGAADGVALGAARRGRATARRSVTRTPGARSSGRRSSRRSRTGSNRPPPAHRSRSGRRGRSGFVGRSSCHRIETGPRAIAYDAAMRTDWLDLGLVPGLASATGRLGMTGHRRGRRPHPRRRHRSPRPLRRGPRVRVCRRLEHRCDPRGPRHRTRPPPDRRHGHPARSRPPSPGSSTRPEPRSGQGETVVIACFGGFGRTGTAVACLLQDAGLTADEAITLTRETRPGTIERPIQVEFVQDWSTIRS